MKTLAALVACASLACALSPAPARAQAQNGRLIDFTVSGTMQMPGMTMPIPTTSREICTRPDQLDPRALAREHQNCTVSNYQASGGTISFHLSCQSPRGVMNSDGVFHHHADGGFDGKLHSVADMQGHAMTMDANYLGTPKGSCTYQPPAK